MAANITDRLWSMVDLAAIIDPWDDAQRRKKAGRKPKRNHNKKAEKSMAAWPTRRRAVFVGLGLAAIFVSALIGWLVLRARPPVTVVVTNNSEKPIATIRVEHEGGVETAENLPRGETRTIQFDARGETSLNLRVRFDDGSENSGGPQYAESGYQFIVTVTDAGVGTSVRLPAY